MNIRAIVILYIPILYTYSTIFLYGFWSINGIDIFVYIDISEIILTAIYHQITWFPFTIFLSLATYSLVKPISDAFLKKELGNVNATRLFEADFSFNLITYIVFLIIYPFFTSSYPYNMFFVVLFGGTLTTILLPQKFPNFCSDVIPDRTTRHFVLTIIIMCFATAYPLGGIMGQYMRYKIPVVEINGTKKTVFLVGKTKSHYFFYTKEKESIEIIDSGSINSLVILSDTSNNNKTIFEKILEDVKFLYGIDVKERIAEFMQYLRNLFQI